MRSSACFTSRACAPIDTSIRTVAYDKLVAEREVTLICHFEQCASGAAVDCPIVHARPYEEQAIVIVIDVPATANARLEPSIRRQCQHTSVARPPSANQFLPHWIVRKT